MYNYKTKMNACLSIAAFSMSPFTVSGIKVSQACYENAGKAEVGTSAEDTVTSSSSSFLQSGTWQDELWKQAFGPAGPPILNQHVASESENGDGNSNTMVSTTIGVGTEVPHDKPVEQTAKEVKISYHDAYSNSHRDLLAKCTRVIKSSHADFFELFECSEYEPYFLLKTDKGVVGALQTNNPLILDATSNQSTDEVLHVKIKLMGVDPSTRSADSAIRKGYGLALISALETHSCGMVFVNTEWKPLDPESGSYFARGKWIELPEADRKHPAEVVISANPIDDAAIKFYTKETVGFTCQGTLCIKTKKCPKK